MARKTIICSDVIAVHERGFVVVERFSEPLGLAFPGGKLDPGETKEEAARREFAEETGLTLILDGEIGYYYEIDRDPRGDFRSWGFHGRASGEPKAEPGKTSVLFLSAAEVHARGVEFISDHYKMFTDYEKFAA